MPRSKVAAFKKKTKKKKSKGRPSIKLAVIDLGTNSVRFDIYSIVSKKPVKVYRTKKMIRLGDGVYKTGSIPASGKKRALEAFKEFKKEIDRFKAQKVFAFATSALRSAKNSASLVKEIEKATGIKVKIISGREEGRLIAKGIVSKMKPVPGKAVLIDIGGGSTEISLVQARQIVKTESFKLGANRLQQVFLKQSPPRYINGRLHPILALRQHIRSSLIPWVKRHKVDGDYAVGSSGTIKAISKILKRLGRTGEPLFRSDLSALVSELSLLNREELLMIPGLEEKRVDLILAGAILLEEFMFCFNIREVLVTDLALRDGLLEEVLAGEFV